MSYPFAPITSPPLRTPLSSSYASQLRSPPENSPALSSSRNDYHDIAIGAGPKTFKTSSVALSCLSPDALSVHSLLPNGTIVTRFLPLHEIPEEISSAYSYNDGNGGENMNPNTNTKKSRQPAIKSITTSLPSHVRNSLQVDPPLEIICIDNDTPTSTTFKNANTSYGSSSWETERGGGGAIMMKSIPLLCVYSRSSAYVFKIQYEQAKGNDRGADVNVWGEIKEVHEPFEAHLTSQGNSPNIRRIRPAPHSYVHNGNLYQTLCNRGAMIMLTANADIVLFHGYDNYDDNRGGGDANANVTMEMCFSNHHVTSPATIHTEQTDMTPIVDFCFMPSSPSSNTQHSLWNAMTLVLSTQNGSLYALSPIVFHNTVFPQAQVQAAHEHLNKMIVQYAHSASAGKMAEYRRARAALQLLNDAFDCQSMSTSTSSAAAASTTKGLYAKANIIDQKKKRRSATTWPVGVQTLFVAQGEDYNDAQCMEVVPPSSSASPMGKSSILGGTTAIVLARIKSLDYILVPSGENILPRFAYEEGADATYLDTMLVNSSMLLEQVVFDNEDREQEQAKHEDGREVVLVSDPVDKTMMHHVSKQGVLTVTTNTVSVTERRLNDIVCGKVSSHKPMEESKTNAWSSISIGDGSALGKTLNGIVISGDAQLGHVLVAILDDGTTESVNMTAALYLNEANNQMTSELGLSTATLHAGLPEAVRESNEALKAVEGMPALHEQIQPIFAQISKGFSNMSKIVGGSTEPRKITPGALATFLAMKQSSEEDIILPVKELDALVTARAIYLKSMRDHQRSQLKQLEIMIETVKKRMQSTSEKMGTVETNMKMLSGRCAAVLSVAKDLTPNITQAEMNYFKDIQRYDVNCGKWEEALENAKTQSSGLRDSVEGGGARIALTDEQKNTCDTLLKGQGEMLRQARIKVKSLGGAVDEMVIANGLGDGREPLAAIGDGNS